jgi:hypothetical protein
MDFSFKKNTRRRGIERPRYDLGRQLAIVERASKRILRFLKRHMHRRIEGGKSGPRPPPGLARDTFGRARMACSACSLGVLARPACTLERRIGALALA